MKLSITIKFFDRQQEHALLSAKKGGGVPYAHRLYTQKRAKHTSNKERPHKQNKAKLTTKKSIWENQHRGESSSKESLVHSKRVQKKRAFKPWSKSSSSLKILRLRSFQTHQNMQMGAKPQTALFFLWKPLTFHWRRRFLTESRNTQVTPKRANKKIQSSLVLAQWIKMWSIDSSLSLQRLHLLTICHPLFIKVSTVRIFPQTASQAKKQVLRRARDPQASFPEKNKTILLT